jgi:acetate kinase
MPSTPQVAAFETAFHQTIPLSRQVYAIPHEWTEKLGIRRYGFHGASHRYIATRVKEIVPDARRVISCHLGGSCSVTAILDGKSVGNSFGMTAQSGVFHCNRVGDFDAFALQKLLKGGLGLEEIFRKLGKEGGLLGMSGVSPDMRDVERAAAEGNARARLAVEAFVESVRSFIGQYLVALGGCDVLAFTGGIGENGVAIREAICRGMEWAGIELDTAKNQVRGKEERISKVESGVQIWIVPTNEELIVARQTVSVLTAN